MADKYIECEFVLIAIDLALHRIQAYRHLLFNRRPFSSHNFHVGNLGRVIDSPPSPCSVLRAVYWYWNGGYGSVASGYHNRRGGGGRCLPFSPTFP